MSCDSNKKSKEKSDRKKYTFEKTEDFSENEEIKAYRNLEK